MKKYLSCFIVCLLPLLSTSASAQGKAQEETLRAVIDADGKQRIKILGGSNFFKPNHIVVKINVPVELSVSLESGIVPHTFVIKAAGAGIVIDESLDTHPKTFAFTPTAVGKYPFHCRNKLLFFKSHQEKGMEGILEVVD